MSILLLFIDISREIPGSCLSRLIGVVLLTIASLLPGKLAAQTAIQVEIEGLEPALENNVRLYLSIEQQKDHPLMSPGRMRRLHRKALTEIAAALQPYGYYRPQITPSLTETDSGEWRALYRVDPGPGLRVAELNLSVAGEMRQDDELNALIDNFSLRPGAVFNHLEYDGFKSALARLASERGYSRGRFTEARVEIDVAEYVARIYLSYDGGPRYRFGEVTMRQQILDDEFLRRFVPFQRGDPYDFNRVLDLQQALNDSGYFRVAEVAPQAPLAQSGEVPVDVSLTPRKQHRYDFGVGYGSDTGARAKLGWQMPRANRRGHRVDSEAVVSERGYDVNANYRVPVFNPRTDQLIYSISEVEEAVEDSDSNLRTVGISLSHNRGEWREVLALTYQREVFEVADDSGDSRLLIPSIGLSRTWGSDFINVLDGLRLDLSLRGTVEALGSDTEFSQLRGSIKFITSIAPSTRIIARGTFGTTSTSDFEELPSSIRFFTGGAQSVRGYAYQSLGPTDEDDEIVGGRYLLVGSLELEHYFNDRWGGALFIDGGDAIDDLDDDLEQGAGFGLRWKSPVGPVRIDAASAITQSGQPWRLHVSIGPDL